MPGTTPPVDDGTGTPPPPAGTGEPPKPPEAPKKLEFTQDELDRIIADRVARAKPKDYDELVALRTERETAAEAEKTELQREKDARLAAEAKAAEKDARANARLIRAAILTEATAQNAVDVDTVAALLASSDITVGDDDEVLGVKEAVKKLLKDKPFLAKGAASKNGSEFGGNDPATLQEKINQLEAAGKWAEARELKITGFVAR